MPAATRPPTLAQARAGAAECRSARVETDRLLGESRFRAHLTWDLLDDRGWACDIRWTRRVR